MKYPAKTGPFRVALANGYIANTWRIQMIQTAKAYAAQPEVAAKLKEFKVVSTGEDVAAQISAVNNFIDSGYDAIVINAQNPQAFAPVIQRAKEAGVILVAFDNILDTKDAINVNVDQKGLGVLWAQLADQARARTAARSSKCAASPAPRSIPTATTASTRRSPPRARPGTSSRSSASGMTRTAQKATADAIAVHQKFDGITAQGGDTGIVQAMIDAGHPMVPFGGETENGFRKFCGAKAAEGLRLLVGGHRPGAGRRRHQDRHRRARGQGHPAVGQAADRHRRRPGLQGRRELLLRPVRQLLRRQRLPDLRHQLHRAGNHGADAGRPVSAGSSAAPRGTIRPAAGLCPRIVR